MKKKSYDIIERMEDLFEILKNIVGGVLFLLAIGVCVVVACWIAVYCPWLFPSIWVVTIFLVICNAIGKWFWKGLS